MRSQPHVWRRGALIALLLGWASQAGAQQTGTVTGRVLDETGSPLPVVQVTITDLSVGVLSQQNGTYTLQNVPVGTHALTAQRLGYRVVTQNVTVTAGGAATADFELGQIALALDAVVVTGTAGGTQRRAIGNVVTQVQAAAVTESMPVTNMVEMLGGRAPGLQFQRTTGVVGEGSAIRIRGVGSVTLGSHPLIFIDGIRADNRTNAGPNGSSASALDDINANDIESIEIIKGPAAATLYGTEASEGVIQIITKRGAQGAPQFDFAVHQGIRFMRDPAGNIGTLFGCRSTSSPPCPVADIFEYNPVDEAKWYIDRIHGPLGTSGIYPGGQTEWNEWPCDQLFCNGHLETYTLSIRGGTDNLRYFVSGEFLGDEGVVPWNWQDRTNVRVNLNMLLTPNLSLDVSTGYVSGYTRFADTPSEGDVFDDMQWGKGYCLIRINPDACTRQGGFQERSPGDMWSIENTREWDRFIGSFTAQHIFREFLTQRFIFGIDNTWEINRNYFPLDPVSPPYRNAQAGAIRYDRPNVSNITLDYAASARTQLNDAFSLNTSVGVQYYEHLTETFRNEGRGFALPVQTTVNQTPVSSLSVVYTYVQNKSLGAYIQEEIGWNDRAFLTVAVRADDNSAFGANLDAQYYPKVSATWVISEEPFWNIPLVNTLRLRSAMGQAGRQPNTFAGQTTWQSYTGPGGAGAVRPLSPGNPGIGPEVSTEIEAGFDIAILNDRISGEFTYFQRTTKDALLNAPFAPSSAGVAPTARGVSLTPLPSGPSGTDARDLRRMDTWGGPSFGSLPPTLAASHPPPGTTIARNLGQIDNWGWEASVNARLMDRQNVTFDLTVNADHIGNEIKDLGDFPGTSAIQVGFPYPNEVNYFNVVGWSEEFDEFGEPLEVYCDAGTGTNNLFVGGETVNCDTVRGARPLVGPSYYTYTFSVVPTLTLYNNLRIFAVAQGMYGKIGDESQVSWGFRYNNGYCTQALGGDPACTEWLVRNRDGMFRDVRMQNTFKADFWKLREVGVQYDLPQAWIQRTGASRASLGLAAREIADLWRARDTLGVNREGTTPGRHIPDSESDGLYKLPGVASLTATMRVTF